MRVPSLDKSVMDNTRAFASLQGQADRWVKAALADTAHQPQ